jgi:glycerophosphoryl diester phosphodiesterase
MTAIIGHRGGRNLWPENSLSGFRAVRTLPVDGVELDVHLSDAGELLVIHDGTLDRTTDGTGPVRALSPADRMRVRLRECAEGVPLLDEVLDVLRAGRFDIHVELKSDAQGQPYAGLAARAAEAIARAGLRDRAWLTSFDPAVLVACRAADPGLRRLISVHAASVGPAGLDAHLALAADLAGIVAVEKSLLRARQAEIARHVPDSRLCVWTVNAPEEIADWLAEGPGYLTSDDPVLALALRVRAAETGEGAAARADHAGP